MFGTFFAMYKFIKNCHPAPVCKIEKMEDHKILTIEERCNSLMQKRKLEPKKLKFRSSAFLILLFSWLKTSPISH